MMSFANVGSADRLIRIVIGAVLVLVPFFSSVAASSNLGILLLVIGAVLIVTGLMSFCPLYRILGFGTRSNA